MATDRVTKLIEGQLAVAPTASAEPPVEPAS
jgi:hypothetical protein